jgi:hypothetical protein
LANKRLGQLREKLRDSDIVWFGTRGIDARALLALDRPLHATSITCPVKFGQAIEQKCLESLTGLRRDFDTYNIDDDTSEAAMQLKREFLFKQKQATVLVAYRPAEMFNPVLYCESNVRLAVNAHTVQRRFEYKPWVESSLMAFGVPMMPSTYVRSQNLDAIQALLKGGTLIARPVSGSGGLGIFCFSSMEEYLAVRPRGEFLSVSPFFSGAIPLNVNAVIYPGAEVAVFGVSFQLIGLEKCCTRRFGYCGNDFYAGARLGNENLDMIQKITERIGEWLAQNGYLGLFGVDLLLTSAGVMVCEINARFQGSTPLSAAINQACSIPDPITEHVAAFLGLPAPAVTLRQQAEIISDLKNSTPTAQTVYRNLRETSVRLRATAPALPSRETHLDGLPAENVIIEREAMLFRTYHQGPITEDGYSASCPDSSELLSSASRVMEAAA